MNLVHNDHLTFFLLIILRFKYNLQAEVEKTAADIKIDEIHQVCEYKVLESLIC